MVLAKHQALGKNPAMGSSSPSMGRMAPVNQEAVRERSTCGNVVVAVEDDLPLPDRFAVTPKPKADPMGSLWDPLGPQ